MIETMCDNEEEWIEKCISCTHCYTRIDDADTLNCRCRTGCHYKKYVSKRTVVREKGAEDGQ